VTASDVNMTDRAAAEQYAFNRGVPHTLRTKPAWDYDVQTFLAGVAYRSLENEKLRAERDSWRAKALDVEKHPVVTRLLEELEALKAECARLADELAAEKLMRQNDSDGYDERGVTIKSLRSRMAAMEAVVKAARSVVTAPFEASSYRMNKGACIEVLFRALALMDEQTPTKGQPEGETR
jgi:hypothetical protein